MPLSMQNHLSRAQQLLTRNENPPENHELLRAVRIQAAHEYGRAMECIHLAYEAEQKAQTHAA